MFNRIWKEQIVKPTSKVGIFKPKQGFDLEEKEKDDKCCEEAREQYLESLVFVFYETQINFRKLSCEILYEWFKDNRHFDIIEEWDRCESGN